MKKTFKIIGITLGSILGVLILAIVVLCNIVFTSEQLTPLVNKYAKEFITCDYHLGKADLTFFSSFPDFAIEISDVELINPVEGAQSDTLLSVGAVSAHIDIKELIKYQAIIVNQFVLKDGYANVYRENDSINNFSVFDLGPDDEEEEDSTMAFCYLGLNVIKLENINATYLDRTANIDARLSKLESAIHGEFFLEEKSMRDVLLDLEADRITLNSGDSTKILVRADDVDIHGEAQMILQHYNADISLDMPHVWFALNGDTLVSDRSLKVKFPADVNLEYMYANLHDGTKISIDDNDIDLKGKVELCDDGTIYSSLNFETNEWNIEKTIGLVPAAYKPLIADYKVAGDMKVKGKVNGTLGDGSFPLVNADLILDDCDADITFVPYPLRDINADINADINLNDGQVSNATIRSLSVKSDDIELAVNGKAEDLLGTLRCNANVKGNLDLEQLKKILPSNLKLRLKGETDLDINAKFTLADIKNLDLSRIKAKGDIKYEGLDVWYNDSIHVKDNNGTIAISLPSPHANKHFKELGQLILKGDKMDVKMVGTMDLVAQTPDLTVGFGDILNDKQFIQADCQFDFSHLSGTMDTITFSIAHPSGIATAFPLRSKPMQPGITATYTSGKISARMGKSMNADIKSLAFSGFTTYDDTKDNILLKLNPTLNVSFADGKLDMASFGHDLSIPTIKFKFTPKQMDIEQSRVILGNSDFNLSGNISNIRGFIENKELLRGDLNFTSSKTDVDEIMALVNGLGSDEPAEPQQAASPEQSGDEGPFMVPKGVDITLNTDIKHAYFNNKDIRNVNGKLTVKDGVLIAEEMAFTSDAAEMQLTAIYRPERTNHLFLGADFHLLNINIKELIELIPSIDTIVPMLKTLEGNAEFHIAAETYLNSKYEPKFSTLRAAAAVEGTNLVLLDNETFKTVAKYMTFDKSTKNIIDSLSVEMTVFRNEVDIYPFLVSIDKWKAVLAGRHNLDMTCDYHMSLCAPIRLGLEMQGSLNNPKFKLVECKYKTLFRPAKRGEVDARTLELKKKISDALKANVK